MKKETKKLICQIVLLSFSAFALVGCGDNDSGSKKKDKNNEKEYVNQASNQIAVTDEASTDGAGETTMGDGDTALSSFDAVNALSGETTQDWGESDWIEWADDMYSRACFTQMEYSCLTNCQLDYDNFITYDDMNFYLCTNFSSKEELYADYYSLFSRVGRENMESDLLLEQDGKIYILPAGRGADISYIDSKVVSASPVGDGTIEFTVENRYYTDSYFEFEDYEDMEANKDNEEYITTKTSSFSVVFEDRIWKIGEFELPY